MMNSKLSNYGVSLVALALAGNAILAPELAAAPARKAAPAGKRAAQSGSQPAKTVDLSGPYTAYVSRLRGKVINNWDYPPGKFHVVLQAVVSSDGSVSDLTLTSNPKGEAAERAASAAFSQAQPLEPLPAQSTPTVRITFNFDSTYDPHGDSNSNLSGRLDPIQPPKLQPASSPAAIQTGSENSESPAGSAPPESNAESPAP
jgi:hypothetical protein